jgi:hypothetical protein
MSSELKQKIQAVVSMAAGVPDRGPGFVEAKVLAVVRVKSKKLEAPIVAFKYRTSYQPGTGEAPRWDTPWSKEHCVTFEVSRDSKSPLLPKCLPGLGAVPTNEDH